MKKLYFIISLLLTHSIHAQMSNFEFPNVPAPGYWNGSDQSGGFSSGDVYFPNKYDTAFGGYWASGFAWSTVNDTTTPGYTNLYASASGGGFNSAGYGVVQQGAVMRLNGGDRVIQGLYINNGTYARLSMRNGDTFAKKFGGITGNDPDFFKVVLNGYNNGVMLSDSIEFYLADYRFSDNSQDYIVKNFTVLPASALGPVDSVKFTLRSSDNGPFGMNTPAFFVIDDVLLAPTAGLESAESAYSISVFPNPSNGLFTLISEKGIDHIQVYDMSGRLIQSAVLKGMHRSEVFIETPGAYLLRVQGPQGIATERLLVR
jgi:hypothetical protein